MFVICTGTCVRAESERATRRSWPPPSRVVPSRWMGAFPGEGIEGEE